MDFEPDPFKISLSFLNSECGRGAGKQKKKKKGKSIKSVAVRLAGREMNVFALTRRISRCGPVLALNSILMVMLTRIVWVHTTRLSPHTIFLFLNIADSDTCACLGWILIKISNNI